MIDMATVGEIASSIYKGQDGSVQVNTGHTPTEGYMVGGCSWTLTVARDSFYAKVVHDFVKAHSDLLEDERFYLGWWTHDDRVYLDVSENVSDLAIAKALGSFRKEIAIWDLNNEEEITL